MSFEELSGSRLRTRERSCSKSNQLQFTSEFTNELTASSPRFGALSHHSFFSRHNPHPHRVRHIQGKTAGFKNHIKPLPFRNYSSVSSHISTSDYLGTIENSKSGGGGLAGKPWADVEWHKQRETAEWSTTLENRSGVSDNGNKRLDTIFYKGRVWVEVGCQTAGRQSRKRRQT